MKDETKGTMPDDRSKRILFRISLTMLAVVTLFWTIFAALSGAEELGGGVKGLLRNLPNSAPWLVLLLCLWLGYRRPFVGGCLFVVAGLVTMVAFDTLSHPLTFVLISLPFVLGGGILAISGWRS